MLMVRRKKGRWIHCIHEETGQPLSLQIQEVRLVGSEYQVTVAFLDPQRNYRILKPGDHDDSPLPEATDEH